MKEKEKFIFASGLATGVVILALLLTAFGVNPRQMEERAKKEAIAHGAAYYEVDTNGVVSFKWNK